MKPDARFLELDKSFWAFVRTISEEVGYTDRVTKEIKVPSLEEVVVALKELGLDSAAVADTDKATALGSLLLEYFKSRRDHKSG